MKEWINKIWQEKKIVLSVVTKLAAYARLINGIHNLPYAIKMYPTYGKYYIKSLGLKPLNNYALIHQQRPTPYII